MFEENDLHSTLFSTRVKYSLSFDLHKNQVNWVQLTSFPDMQIDDQRSYFLTV